MLSKNIAPKNLTFAYSFKPIHILSRIFGFMPFTIVLDSSGAIQTARVTVLDCLWFITFIGTYIFSTLYFIMYIRGKEVPSSIAMLAYSTQIIVIVRKLLNCACIATDMCNRRKFVDILKKISIFDEKVSYHC